MDVSGGGLLAKSLFEEARYCYIYAQFLAAVLLGLAYVERTLAALFYGAGRNDLERVPLSKLLKEAQSQGLISQEEFRDLNRVRENRNSYAHFRRPGNDDTVEFRAISEHEPPYNLNLQDATAVMATMFRIVPKNSF